MKPVIDPVIHGGVPEGEPVHRLAPPFVWMIRGYQVAISPALGARCRFYPSCSAYTVTAIERFGPARGIWMGAWRIGRCHPWQRGGVDHVPLRDGTVPASIAGEAADAPRHTSSTDRPTAAAETPTQAGRARRTP